jgi:hypothetical protein
MSNGGKKIERLLLATTDLKAFVDRDRKKSFSEVEKSGYNG